MPNDETNPETQTGGTQHRIHTLENDRAGSVDVFGRINTADKDKLTHANGMAGRSERKRDALGHHRRTVAVG